MSKAIRLLQMSDLHLGKDLSYNYKGVIPYHNALKVMQKINNLDFDALVVTGDISEDGSKESYQHFKTLCDENLPSSPYLLVGNHDNYEVMKNELETFSLCEHLQMTDWLFIFINSQHIGFDDGKISQEEYKRIENLIKHTPHKYLALFMHHHALPSESWLDKYILQENEKFLSWIKEFPTLRAVINGHIHQECFEKDDTISFYGSPATSVQFVPKLEKAELAKLGPAYREFIFEINGEIKSNVYYL